MLAELRVNKTLSLCLKALRWLWQDNNLKPELDDMQKERESTLGEKAKTVKDVLTSRCVRWQLLTLTIPCAGVQFCGINAVRSALPVTTEMHTFTRQHVGFNSLPHTPSSHPAVLLCLWHLPWVRRARGPDALHGHRHWSNRAHSCDAVCKHRFKTSWKSRSIGKWLTESNKAYARFVSAPLLCLSLSS